MFLLVLMLDNPELMDRILEAWAKLGIRGAHGLESAACRVPEHPERAPTGFLSFASLLPPSRACSALVLAPVDSQAMAERAAAEVARIAGPWAEGRAAAMLSLPIASTWGNVFPAAIPPPPEENTEDAPPREPGQPCDAP